MQKLVCGFFNFALKTVKTATVTSNFCRCKSEFPTPKINEDIDEISSKSSLEIHKKLKIELLPHAMPYPADSLFWDGDTKSLYYVDCRKRIVRYDYENQKSYQCDLKQFTGYPSFMIPVQGDNHMLAVGIGKSVELMNWNGVDEACSEVRTLFEVEHDEEQFEFNSFNVGKCDSKGRLFTGTTRDKADNMSYRYGSIYKYIPEDADAMRIFLGVGIPSGFSWSHDATKFFFVDTGLYKVIQCDYNDQAGTPTDPRPIYDLPKMAEGEHLFIPFDMTIDSEDNIFLTTMNSGKICKMNTKADTWKCCHELRLPCISISSICFGGPDMDILFASVLADKDEKVKCYLIKILGLGSKGLPMTKLKLT